MKHLQIILIVFNLILGTGAVFYIYQLFKRHKLNYLKTLVYYLISLNLLVFVDFLYKYTLSLVDFESIHSFSSFLITTPVIILYIAEFGITFFIYRITEEFKDSALSRKVLYAFITGGAVFLLTAVWGVIDYITTKSAYRFYIVHAVWIFTMLMVILLVLILHIMNSQKIPNAAKRKSMLAFGYIFLAAFFLFTLGQLDYYTIELMDGYYMDHLLLILLNLSPLVWIHYYFQKPDEIVSLEIANEKKLEGFIKYYNISTREKDIIELLLRGRTNKEIETELFISVNTVKNHIYAIFKKAGVNSRAQLINLIQRFEENS